MTTYSTSFFAGTHSGGLAFVYTPPAGFTTIIRDVTAYNAGSTTDAVEIGIGSPGTAIPVVHQSNVAGTSSAPGYQGRVVLPPGMQIYVASGGNPWWITISGYSLSP